MEQRPRKMEPGCRDQEPRKAGHQPQNLELEELRVEQPQEQTWCIFLLFFEFGWGRYCFVDFFLREWCSTFVKKKKVRNVQGNNTTAFKYKIFYMFLSFWTVDIGERPLQDIRLSWPLVTGGWKNKVPMLFHFIIRIQTPPAHSSCHSHIFTPVCHTISFTKPQ